VKASLGHETAIAHSLQFTHRSCNELSLIREKTWWDGSPQGLWDMDRDGAGLEGEDPVAVEGEKVVGGHISA